jgi:hypothetical protein
MKTRRRKAMDNRRLTVAGALCVTVLVSAMTPGAEKKEPSMKLIEVRKIWDKAPHNAFTDLARHRKRWWCVFREGKAHVSPDGSLRVITSSDGIRWKSAALLKSKTEDLRDAKLTIAANGMFHLYGAGVDKRKKPQVLRSYVWTSRDGRRWSKARAIGAVDEWLWRVTLHGKAYYGIGYGCAEIWRGEKANTIRLYKSKDGRTFEVLVDRLRSGDYSNETSIVFRPDKTALCLLRRDPLHGLLGTARPPYTTWSWLDVGCKIGGPHMLLLPDGRLLAAVRLYGGGARTSLCWIDAKTGTLTEALKLPSGGDTSYAGLVLHEGVLWVSYYSSHERKTAIYLAKVTIGD